jgi:DNA-binding SARP family transcriptional activator/tetratricopeptide (TPR) repeat protein
VLAVLLLEPGTVVSVHRLIDLVWGERPPATARKALQVYVSGLRRALAGIPGATLRTRGDGYCLDLAADDVDVHRFRRLTDQAANAEPDAAERILDEALALWRGTALSDVDSDPLRHALVEPLTEERLAAVENLAAARIALGRPAAPITALSALIAEYPLREHAHVLLMRALHVAGRDAEALATFADLRVRLAEELGAEPGPVARQLHETILRGDAPAAAVPVPAQLPAATDTLLGRDDTVRHISHELLRAGGPRIVTLHGQGGIGKTALAVHVARRVRERFPDGQLFAELGGLHVDPATATAVLGGFLRALGVPPGELPAGEAERGALFRTITSGRRMLVVLDDARDSAQVRTLLPGGPDTAVLVTSRGRLTGLLDAVAVAPGLLSEMDAIALLTAVAGRERVAADPAAAREIVLACELLPLAIRIAAARLSARPDWRLTDVVRRLTVVRRMDELRADDLAVRSSFALSYRQLDDEHARTFRLLAAPPVTDLGAGAAAALLDRTEHDAERIAEDLVDASLLDTATAGRYRFHDLMRLFAREQATAHDHPADALARLVGYYAAGARTASRALSPRWLADPVDHVDLPGAEHAPALADEAAAVDWLATEYRNVFASVCAAARVDDVPVAALAAVLCRVGRYCDERGLWEHWAEAAEAVATSARRQRHAAAEGTAMRCVGTISLRHGRFTDAEREFRHALRLSRRGGDGLGQARAMNSLGVLCHDRGRYVQQLDWLRQAERRYDAVGDERGVMVTLNNLASGYLRLGTPEKALPGLRRGLRIARRHGDTAAEMYVRNHLGSACHALGEHDAAIDHHTHALSLARHLGNGEVAGYALAGLGKANHHAGRPEQARRYLEEAAALARQQGAARAPMLREITELLAHQPH